MALARYPPSILAAYVTNIVNVLCEAMCKSPVESISVQTICADDIYPCIFINRLCKPLARAASEVYQRAIHYDAANRP